MEPETLAANLLTPLWRGIGSEYKSKYRTSIWQQFEDNVRSAAYTSRLGAFYDAFCRKLAIALRADDVASVQAVLTSGQDRAILRLLRDETTLLVLLVRVANEERKATYEAETQGALF